MKQVQRIIGLLVGIIALGGCTNSQTSQNPAAGEALVSQAAERWGIEVQQIGLSAEGYMLDFRYRIKDPLQARSLMDRNAECYVIDQKSGAKMIVPAPPKVGSLRQKSQEPVEGKIYYVMFANPGRRIRQGDKVTVVINEMLLPDLVVQ